MKIPVKPLNRSFFERSTVQVAADLLGKCVVRRYDQHLLIGLIIETEAYQGSCDPASHAFKGKTRRNFPMFGPCGVSYVYFTYGMHYCLNVVAREVRQDAGAVLIRGVIPTFGIEIMQKLRKGKINHLTDGPAKLTQAFAIERHLNNIYLTQVGSLFLSDLDFGIKKDDIEASSRIGIREGIDKKWRFVLKNINSFSG